MRTLPKWFRDFRIRYLEISAASDALGEAVPLGMAGLRGVEGVLARRT